MSIECTMPSAPRASPGIFKDNRDFGGNIKVPKSNFSFSIPGHLEIPRM